MIHADEPQTLEPVHADEGEGEDKQWASWLVLFLRVMAVASLVKGLYHWAVICGINAPFPSGFDFLLAAVSGGYGVLCSH